MFDSNLMFRTQTAMTVSESLGPLTIYGTPIRGMNVRITIPSSNLNDTVLPTLFASTDGSTYNVLSRYGAGATKCTGGKELNLPFMLPKGQKTYLKLELSVALASTTGVFGVVVAGLTMGGGADVDRTKSWTL